MKVKHSKTLLVCFILIFCCVIFARSFQFRMSDQEVYDYFEDQNGVSVEHILVEETDIRFLWMDNGKEKTIFFVHGAPGSATEFISFFAERKLTNKFNLLSLDRPGYGYSDFGHFKVDLKDQARCLAEIIKSLQLDNVILVGHSLGAPIAIRGAVDYPELFQGLVLVGASMDPDLEPKEWYRPWLRNWLCQIVLPTSLYGTNEEIYHLKPQLKELTPSLGQLELPILAVHGSDDTLVPKENIDYLEKYLISSEFEVWLESGVDHFIPWNRPDLMIDGILKLNEKL